jgi:hypothetical protein
MSRGSLHINELRLRATGLSREQARPLGEMVAQRLAKLPLRLRRNRRIASVNMRVNFVAAQSVEGLADQIVRRIQQGVMRM